MNLFGSDRLSAWWRFDEAAAAATDCDSDDDDDAEAEPDDDVADSDAFVP